MKATETSTSTQTVTNAAPAALPSKISKLIFLQRATITTLFSSLLVVAFYAYAAQNRAAHWKTETVRLQAQLVQTALAQAEQNEAEPTEKAALASLPSSNEEPMPVLRPGMTRAAVERVMTHDSGPFAIGEERYIYPTAPAADPTASRKVVMVTIHYLPAKIATLINADDTHSLFLRDDDVIDSISAPYFQEPHR